MQGINEFHYSGVDNLDVMASAHNYNSAILNFIVTGIRKEDKILEFGAGKGEFCNKLTENYYVEGIEIDENLHRYLKTQKKHYALNEITTTFDLIYSINVLEHVEDDIGVLRSFYNLLNKNSKLRIFVPAREELFSKMDIQVGHLRRYTKDNIEKLLLTTGFRIQKISYYDFLGYFTTLVYKYLTKKNGNLTASSIMLYDRFIFPLSHYIDTLSNGKILGKNLIIEAIKV